MEIDKPIAIFVILIVIIALMFLFILPKHSELKSLQRLSIEKEAELKAKSEYYFRIESLWKDLERREDQISKIDTIVPTDIELSSLVNFLDIASEESGVVFKSIKFQKSNPLRTTTKMAIQENFFNLEIIGTYFAFKNFLRSLEQSARLIEVENISFSPTGAETVDAKNFNLTIKVYSL